MKHRPAAAAALIAIALFLSACGGGENGAAKSVPAGSYELNIPRLPVCWDPQRALSDEDKALACIFSPPLVQKVRFGWEYEMAEDIADITSVFPEKDQWGIEEDSGRVWRISLRKDACWQDGTSVLPQDYVYSMEQLVKSAKTADAAAFFLPGRNTSPLGMEEFLLSGLPDLKENREGESYSGNDIILSENGQYVTPEGKRLYLAVAYPLNVHLEGNSLADYVNTYGSGYFGLDNWDKLTSMQDENGLVPLTEESKALFLSVITSCESWGEKEKDLPEYLVYDAEHEVRGWETVGFYRSGSNELTYITSQTAEKEEILEALSVSFLLERSRFEAGKKILEDEVINDYGTVAELTASCGPYMPAGLFEGRRMVLVKNPGWYGWEDGRHIAAYPQDRLILVEKEDGTDLFNWNAILDYQ